MPPLSDPPLRLTVAADATPAPSAIAARAMALSTLEAAQEVLPERQNAVLPLVPYLDSLRWVFIAAALAGIAVAIYARPAPHERTHLQCPILPSSRIQGLHLVELESAERVAPAMIRHLTHPHRAMASTSAVPCAVTTPTGRSFATIRFLTCHLQRHPPALGAWLAPARAGGLDRRPVTWPARDSLNRMVENETIH